MDREAGLMAKIRLASDHHPGEEVMDGVDAAVKNLLTPAVTREPDKHQAFLDELRWLGRVRRARRTAPIR